MALCAHPTRLYAHHRSPAALHARRCRIRPVVVRADAAAAPETQPSAQKPVVVVTGCSSGIGKQTALQLSQKGWRVFAGVRRDEDAAAVKGLGASIEPLFIDVARYCICACAALHVLHCTAPRKLLQGGRRDWVA